MTLHTRAAAAAVLALAAGGTAALVTASSSDAAPHSRAFVAPNVKADVATRFDLEGHRGTRGLRPEDTLPAFAKALDIGVRTLELDTGVTKDGVVVISHDSFINPDVCTDTAPATPSGNRSRSSQRDTSFPYVGKYIHDLTFAQVETLDCGVRNKQDQYYNSELPVPGTRIPTLDQVFALVEARHADDVQLNIETKIDPTAPSTTVGPKEFVQRDLAVIKRHKDGVKRSLLQSFDWRTLAISRTLAPSLRRVALTEADTAQVGEPGKSPWLGGIDVDQAPYKGDIAYAAKSVGAAVWSPDQTEVTSELVASAHKHNELVVPYTVDTTRDMQKQIGLGVDGIITDYPDWLRDVLAADGYRLPARYPAN